MKSLYITVENAKAQIGSGTLPEEELAKSSHYDTAYPSFSRKSPLGSDPRIRRSWGGFMTGRFCLIYAGFSPLKSWSRTLRTRDILSA